MVSVSETPPSRWQRVREQVGAWIEAPRQQALIVTIILLNAVTLGLETVPALHARYGTVLSAIDHVFIGIFVVEILCKLVHRGGRFFASGWNLFDFVIVLISLFPASGVFSVMRTLRILRTLRLLNKMRQLRHIVEAMLQALPGLGWITVLLFILFYVFGILGSTLFGQQHPHLFGNLAITFYTLFELMTLEGWTTMARDVLATHPHAYLFFIPFLLLASYTLLNLVIGVIISSMDGLSPAKKDADTPEMPAAHAEAVLEELCRLHEKIDRLERQLAARPEEQLDPAR